MKFQALMTAIASTLKRMAKALLPPFVSVWLVQETTLPQTA